MKSGRVIKETASYCRSIGLVAWEAILDQDKQDKFPSVLTQYELQKKMDHHLAFAATTNPDTLYAHEAMKAPDRQQFIDAIEAELSQHKTRGNFVLVKKEDIPPGNEFIDMVWSMRKKEGSTLKKSTSGKHDSMCMEDFQIHQSTFTYQWHGISVNGNNSLLSTNLD